MRESVQKASSVNLWKAGKIPGLFLHSSVYLLVGLMVLGWRYHKARTKGTLGHY